MREFEELNPEQKKAALHKEGPLLVLAGAGAGKTRVITARIFNLIKEGVNPREILAITFTNKAASEMRERVERSLQKGNLDTDYRESPTVSTFHSLGVQILREKHREADLLKYFTIYDRNDSMRAVKKAIKNAGYDTKQFNPSKLLSFISKIKGDAIEREDFNESLGNEYFGRVISVVWEEYDKILKKEKALDFSDLLLKPFKLLQGNQNLLEEYQNRFKYIHVDEYQDTNKVQYDLTKLLAIKHRNIFVVGDIDQNIYSWRGASIQNIFNFEKDFKEAQTILLEENYRSTKTILDTANKVIEKNKKRKEKNLFTKKDWGDKISVFSAYDEKEESLFVAQKSKELIEKGVAPEEIAVLYRANFQSRILEESFIEKSVPYQVLGVRFFERKEIKDVLSYLKAALNPDSLGDVERVINFPRRGIGKVTIARVFGKRTSALTPAVKKKVDEFFTLLSQIKEVAEKERPSETLKFIIEKSGIEKHFKKGDDDDLERLENVRELVTLATKYDALGPEEGINKLLEEAALASEQDSLDKKFEKKKAVRLMTVHAAKGLEFDYVFITGLEDGLFPHQGLSDDNNRDEEEERRLFYVALTRARRKLFLTLASSRTIYGGKQVNLPSDFFEDIDEKVLEEEEFLNENFIHLD